MPRPTKPVDLPAGTLTALVRRSHVSTILEKGYLAPNQGGPFPLGSPIHLGKRLSCKLPPPFLPDLGEYAAFKLTPKNPSAYAALTGHDEGEIHSPDELVFLLTSMSWLEKLGIRYVYTDLGVRKHGFRTFTDACGLAKLDRQRLMSGDFDARKDPLAPHILEAELFVHGGVPPRAVQGLCCHKEAGVPSLEAEVAAAGRTGRIEVRADSNLYFETD